MSRPRSQAALSDADRSLLEAATRARRRAHAPFSRHRVGAAARAADGTVHLGCNVELSSYGLTLCAERVALFAARAAGASRIEALAVVGPGKEGRPTPPCGACRQVIWELAGDIPVLLGSPGGGAEVWRARELLPEPFDAGYLEEE